MDDRKLEEDLLFGLVLIVTLLILCLVYGVVLKGVW